MANLTIERFDRDCPYNDKRRAENDTRNMIRDFKILIAGEHRATFKKMTVGRGYELYDADKRPIGASRHYPQIGCSVATQSEFEETVHGFLKSGAIPTLAKMAELRVAEEAEKASKQALRIEAERISIIRAAGVELYEALKSAMVILEGANRRCTNDTVLILNCRAAIAKAEGLGDCHPEKTEAA